MSSTILLSSCKLCTSNPTPVQLTTRKVIQLSRDDKLPALETHYTIVVKVTSEINMDTNLFSCFLCSDKTRYSVFNYNSSLELVEVLPLRFVIDSIL